MVRILLIIFLLTWIAFSQYNNLHKPDIEILIVKKKQIEILQVLKFIVFRFFLIKIVENSCIFFYIVFVVGQIGNQFTEFDTHVKLSIWMCVCVCYDYAIEQIMHMLWDRQFDHRFWVLYFRVFYMSLLGTEDYTMQLQQLIKYVPY